eukprot:10979798-Alexandrium_andersonii.AAC.1
MARRRAVLALLALATPRRLLVLPALEGRRAARRARHPLGRCERALKRRRCCLLYTSPSPRD